MHAPNTQPLQVRSGGMLHLCAGICAVVGDGVAGGEAVQVLLVVDQACTTVLQALQAYNQGFLSLQNCAAFFGHACMRRLAHWRSSHKLVQPASEMQPWDSDMDILSVLSQDCVV